VQAESATGPNGGVLEGVVNFHQLLGEIPDAVYLCVAPYETADGGHLISDNQVPASTNSDANIDANEYFRFPLSPEIYPDGILLH